MNGVDDGGPAFPCIKGAPSEYALGITLRDYFAIHADWGDVHHYSHDDCGRNLSRTKARYAYADAMIRERKDKK